MSERLVRQLLQPFEIDPITAQDGTVLRFYVSKFPATEGREIVTQYPVTALPKIGEYKTNEALMFRVLNHCAVILDDGRELVLSNRALIDNHTRDFEVLMRLEYACMQYNVSFLRAGKLSNYLESLADKFPQLITEILTRYSEQSSAKDKPL